jgi:hypothetical protein
MWGVVPSFLFAVSVAASQKKPDFGTPKMENAFSLDETKISLYDVPCHPKGHTRVRFGLGPINYAMIRAKCSSFDLKAMQPRMW